MLVGKTEGPAVYLTTSRRCDFLDFDGHAAVMKDVSKNPGRVCMRVPHTSVPQGT